MLDHLPDIPRSLSFTATDLRPLNDLVLIETSPREGMVGSLYLPETVLDHYPTSGWVYAVGPDITEDIRVGDYALIEEEGLSLGYSYYDVFEIILRHDAGIEKIWADFEVEPVVREQVTAFRRGGSDAFLTMEDKLAGGSISFNCSDVLSWQPGQLANPTYNLTYVPVSMYYLLNEDDQLALFYLTSERRILATVERT